MLHRSLVNVMLGAFPTTRFFRIKRWLCKQANIDVGKNTAICGGTKFYGNGKIQFGENCWIGINSKFYTSADSSLIIGDAVDIAPEVVFHHGSHEIGDKNRRAGPGYSKDIFVGSGSWIGVRSVLLAGAYIPTGCIVAAGTLVNTRIESCNVLVAGVPAKVKRTLS